MKPLIPVDAAGSHAVRRNASQAIALFLLLFGTLLAPLADAATTINSIHSFAWSANAGWVNWRGDGANAAVIGEYVCSGYLYGANVGWIHLGNGSPANHIQYQNNAIDFGVNSMVDPAQPAYATLRGYAYGANIGWIYFGSLGNPRVAISTGVLAGYAYAANCGWINLNDLGGHYVQTDSIAPGVDTDGNGLADAWEYTYFGGIGRSQW